MAKQTAISFIAEDTRLVGDIQSNARLMVEGSVEGNIRCAELTISPSGRVAGDLQAGTVSVAGRHNGTVVAHKKLTIHATGSVEGTILTRSLIIEEGGRVDGDIKVMTAVEEFPEHV
ncbi:MAG: polymer-forming cytoskeletal protein [Deltaproteobacteria bacterium]|nr:polymer-forming cytoskeletal protein [Deltaproteobacteria bacterium]